MDAPLEKRIVNTLKCGQCKKYLSILPVKVYANKSFQCGRCSSGPDGIDSKRFETILENLKFPCINRYEGCTELLIPKDMKIHEENCIKSNVSCPVCKERFTECSLLVVEHCKEKHPEGFIDDPSGLLNINLNKKNLELIYLSINASLDHKAKIIKTFFNDTFQGLIVYWADIGKDFQPGNFELRNMENKTIHKTCNGYSQIDLNEFPGHIVMCKILFDSLDNNKEIKNKVPVSAVDPVIQGIIPADKSLNIELEFPNIFLLTNERHTTECFYLAGTSWVFGIERNRDKDDFLFLNCCLEKKEVPIENKYSFQLNGTIGIRAIEFSIAQEIKIEKAVTDKIFGKRPQESMYFMLTEVMRWRNGFNPEIADLLKPKYSIKISLNLKLTGIYIHEKLCKCSGCLA